MEIVHCAQRGSLSLELDSEHYTGILYRLASKYSQTFQQLSKIMVTLQLKKILSICPLCQHFPLQQIDGQTIYVVKLQLRL